MIDYRFNQWRMSGEQATEWTEAESILSLHYDEAKILYVHYVKGIDANDINKTLKLRGAPYYPKAVIRGYKLDKPNEVFTFHLAFMELLENNPDRLDQIFKEVA